MKRYKLGAGETAGIVAAKERFGDLPGLRVGFWGAKPREGEVKVGSLSVRPRDPDMPVFAREGEE